MKGFKIFGYSIDFYEGRKYMGCLIIDEPDRDSFGYHSRKEMTYKGELKKGTKMVKVDGTYMTELVPLCGRIK